MTLSPRPISTQGNVTYDHDGSQTSADSFDFTVDDGAGTTTSSTFNFTVTNVNDAPVVTVSGVDLNFTEQSPVGIDVSATISDVDDVNLEGAVIQIVGNYEAGFDQLSFTDQNGISGVWDSGSGTLTLSGTATVANYQAALQSITFYNSSDQPSLLTRTVQWTVNDGVTDSVSVTRNIVMNAVNDTPSVSGPGSAYSATEQTNLNIHGTGFSVTDVDAASGTMTATFTVGEGTLTLAAGDSGVSITANNASTVTFTGTLAQIDALLTGSSTGTIVYNNGSDTPAASTTITLTVNDGGNTGSDPGLTADGTSEEDSASQTINITATNDAPTLDNSGDPTMTTITEDDTNNGGMTVASLLATGAAGDPIADVDGDPEGIAITSRVNGRGQWQYSIDGGTNWLNVGTVSDTEALLLRSTDLVRFAPDGQNGTIKTFEFRAWDQSSGTAGNKVDASTNGGSTAFSSATEIATITTTDVNDAPVLDNSGAIALNTQAEDLGPPTGAVGTAITDFITNGGNVTDVDASSQAGIAIIDADTTNGIWWYSTDNGSTWNALGSVSDSSARVLNASSVTRIYFQSNADFNGTITDAITFRAWDRSLGASGSLQDASTHGGTTAFSSATETADLTITATNDDPTNAGSLPTDVTVTEDVLSAIDLSGVDFSDADAGGSDLTVTLSTSTGGELTLAADANIVFGGTATARTLTGTLAELNTYFDNTSNIQYLHPTQHLNGDNADTITVVINDNGNTGSGGGTDQTLGVVNVDITAVNDRPVLDNSGIMSLTSISEDDTNPTGDSVADIIASAGGDRITDVDGDPEGIAIVQVEGLSGTWQYRTSGSGPWTDVGSVSLTNALLLGATSEIRFIPDPDYHDSGVGIQFYAWDQHSGSAGTKVDPLGSAFSIDLEIALLQILPVNDDPTNAGTLPSDITVDEDVLSDVDLSAINFEDVDAGASTLTVTLSTSTGGQLSSSTGGGVVVGGSATNMTFTGTLGDLNSFFDSAGNIQYLHGTQHLNGDNADTITVVINDNGNTGSGGGTDQTLGVVNVDITAVNDTPVNTVPGTQTVAEETATAISGISISDVDAASGNVTTRLEVNNGSLNVSLSGSATISAGSNGSGDVTIQGTIADINATLASLTYTGDTDVVGTAADTLTVTTNDQGNTGSGGALTDIDTVQINITAVNDTPVVTGPGSAYTVNEQTGLSIHGTGFSVTDVDAGSGTMIATIAVGEGSVTIASGNSGVSVTSGNGSGSVQLIGNLASINGLLTGTSTGTITYFNSSDTPSASTTITVTVNDDGHFGADPGLTADAVSEEDSASQTINITAVNDDPTLSGISGDSLNYTEGDGAVVIDSGVSAAVADVDSTDFDSGYLRVFFNSGSDSSEDVLAIRNQGTSAGQIGVSGSNVTYGGSLIGTVTGGTGGATLEVTLNANADTAAVSALMQNITFENTDTDDSTTGTRTVHFRVNDGDGGTSLSHVATVTVSGDNDAPVASSIEGTALGYTENDGAVAITSTLSVSDVDDTNIESAVIQITGNYANGEDFLAFTDTANITGVWDSGNRHVNADRFRYAGELRVGLAIGDLCEHE